MLDKIVFQLENQYGRKIAFCSFIGSTNYGLDIDISDKDLIAWVIPNKLDIYKSRLVDVKKSNFLFENEIYEIQLKDIRSLIKNLFYHDPMILEQLYVDSYVSKEFVEIIEELRKNEWSKGRIYKGLKGMFYNHHKWVIKGVETLPSKSSSLNYVKEYKINSKSLSNLYRLNFMMIHLKETTFDNLIYLSDNEREEILKYKCNLYNITEEESKALANDLQKEIDSYKEYFNQFYTETLKLRQEETLWDNKMLDILLKENIFS